MKGTFTARAEALASAVGYTARWLDPKPVIPAHSGLLLDAQDGVLRVSGFGENATARACLDIGGDAVGQTVVSGRLLAELLKALPGQTVTLEQRDATLFLDAGRYHAGLPLMSENDYPTLPPEAPGVGTANGEELAQAISRVQTAADRGDNPALSGIHVQFRPEGLTFTATDRYRVARVTIDWRPTVAAGAQALVPAAALAGAVDAFDADLGVTIGTAGETFSLTTAARSLVCRTLPADRFPAADLDRILATEHPAQVTLNRRDLTAPLKRAGLLMNRETSAVRVQLGQDAAVIGVQSNGESDEAVDVSYDGEDTALLFHGARLADALSSASGDVLVLHFTPGRTRPVVLTSETDPTWRHAVVPLKNLGGN